MMPLENPLRKIASLVVILILCLFYDTVPLGAQEKSCFSTLWPHEKSKLDPDQTVVYGKMANGFRYAIKQNTTPRDRVAIYLDVQAGAVFEREHERGYAHFLEHMLFNGTTHFPPGELIEYFQSIGMQFGADTNGYTTYDETVYTIVLPEGTIEEVEKGLLVMSDYARGALLLPSEVESERGVILAEKLSRDSVEYRTRVATLKNALEGTLLAQRQPIGTEETLMAADSEALKTFYDRWYRPENMVLVVVGDMEPEQVEKAIRKRFEDFKGRGTQPSCPDIGKIQSSGLRAFYHHEPEAGKTRVSVESYWNKKKQDDSKKLQKKMLRNYLATSIVEKRLQKLAEKKVGVLSSPRVYFGDHLGQIGYAGLTASTSPERWSELLPLLERMLRQAIVYGVNKEEMITALKNVRAYYRSQLQKEQSRKSTTIARHLVYSINNNRVYQSPRQEMELFEELASSLTVDDVNDGLRELFGHDDRLIEVTGNLDMKVEKPRKEILHLYSEAQNREIEPYRLAEKKDFPYLKVPEETVQPVEKLSLEDIGVEKYRFGNKIQLLLKKTDFKKNEVRLRLDFGPGRRGEPAPGMSMVAKTVVKHSGSGALKKSEFQEALAGSSVQYDFSIGKSSFSLSGSALTDEMELLVQTLYTLLRDPAVREDTFRNSMIRFEQMYTSMQSDIGGAERLLVVPFLAGESDLFGFPSLDEVKAISLEELRRWIFPIFARSVPQISIVGDIEKETVVKLVGRYFGTLETGEGANRQQVSVGFPKGQKRTFTVDSQLEQSLLAVAWKTEGFRDISSVRRLNMLASVLDDRLRLTVREKLGAAYSPAVYNYSSRFDPDYGYIYVRIVIDAQNREKVQEAVMSICSDMAENGVTEEELLRVKKPLLTSLKDMVRTNGYWLNTVLGNAFLYPGQLQWPKTVLDDHAAASAADLSKLAKRYLRVDEAAVAFVRPE